MLEKLIEMLIALILSIFATPVATPTYIECGCCGAHVTEWWYVRDMANTEFVEVCHDCYELFK